MDGNQMVSSFGCCRGDSMILHVTSRRQYRALYPGGWEMCWPTLHRHKHNGFGISSLTTANVYKQTNRSKSHIQMCFFKSVIAVTIFLANVPLFGEVCLSIYPVYLCLETCVYFCHSATYPRDTASQVMSSSHLHFRQHFPQFLRFVSTTQDIIEWHSTHGR